MRPDVRAVVACISSLVAIRATVHAVPAESDPVGVIEHRVGVPHAGVEETDPRIGQVQIEVGVRADVAARNDRIVVRLRVLGWRFTAEHGLQVRDLVHAREAGDLALRQLERNRVGDPEMLKHLRFGTESTRSRNARCTSTRRFLNPVIISSSSGIRRSRSSAFSTSGSSGTRIPSSMASVTMTSNMAPGPRAASRHADPG